MPTAGVAVSVLSDPHRQWPGDTPEPEFFRDLNLDQVVGAVTALRSGYDLGPFYLVPVDSVEVIAWRHEVLRDLEVEAVRRVVDAFAEGMRLMRERLKSAAAAYYARQRQAWFLTAAHAYRDTLRAFASALPESGPRSRALTRLAAHVDGLASSPGFVSLSEEIDRLSDGLAGVRYCLHILDNHITVSGWDRQSDYSAEVLAVFDKFKRAEARDHLSKVRSYSEMNHVEAQIVDKVATLNPELFAALAAFTRDRSGYLDPTVATFDREVQFYLAWLDHTATMRAAGLSFCYPKVSGVCREVSATDTFDVALAAKLLKDKATVVTNDVHLTFPERVIVITGPNQGGKTTMARAFGQLHYLAALGLVTPGTQTRLPLFDQMFTHFERGENLQDLTGKLEDDLARVHTILEQATPRSVIIMNEIFTSTTLNDAVALGSRVLTRILDVGCLAVCVTFVDELARLDDAVVSMASTVDPTNPAVRTYKVVRHVADGLAYANAIAHKYGLTYERLTERIHRPATRCRAGVAATTAGRGAQ